MSNRTIFQSVLVSLGTVTNSFLGLLFYVLIARSLSVSGFGNFSFILGFGLIAAEIGDLGLGTAIVKFGTGKHFANIFTLALTERLAIGLILLLVPNFYFSAITGLSLLFVSLVTQSFLARQEYGSYIFTNIFGNIVRLGLVFYLASRAFLGVETGLNAFVLANLMAFFLGTILIVLKDKKLPLNFSHLVKNFFKVFNYSRWVALSFSLASLSAKLDIPIIFLLSGPTATGIYASAQKLASVFLQINAAIDGVFAPKFSTTKETKKVIKEYLFLTVIIALGLLIFLPVSPIIINFIFGSKYIFAIKIFQIMILGIIFIFFSAPFAGAILYRFGKSSYHLIISAGQLIVSVVLYFLLVPSLGAAGAAMGFALTNLLAIGGYLYFYRRLTK